MANYLEDCGIVIGLISYPYYVHGHDLYTHVIKKTFFTEYENRLIEYAEDENELGAYQPVGYRLFGDYGLAVISLIDDFAFCNRVFHSDHGFVEEDDTTPGYIYNCHVITGVADTEKKEDSYLREKFRKILCVDGKRKPEEEEKTNYPFIGITKLKVRNDLLIGTGTNFTNAIKKYISSYTPGTGEKLETIVVDCFDNNEITILSFSDSLLPIHKFAIHIRALTVESIEPLGFDLKSSVLYHNLTKDNPDGSVCEIEGRAVDASVISKVHLFSSTHTSMGYHTGHTFPSIPGDESIKIKLRWEAKPGHIKQLRTLLEPAGEIGDITMTGGNTISQTRPLEDIPKIELLCKDKNLQRHVRKLKIRLCMDADKDSDTYDHTFHLLSFAEEYRYNKYILKELRSDLDACRVSKILRERLLKLYGLFDNCVEDPLFTSYFLELRGALDKLLKTVKGFKENESESIEDIARAISNTISKMEEAYYNRLYEKNIKDTNLEYNGGIQQYVTSFDWAYKLILKTILYKNEDTANQYLDSFIFVSGYEEVSSDRMNLRLNINQITYPELFATSVWKEASNYTYSLLEDYSQVRVREVDDKLSLNSFRKKHGVWSSFIHKKGLFNHFIAEIASLPFFNLEDDTCDMICSLMRKETIEYVYIDLQTYHFGFNRDFDLLYYSYWKYFLQMAQYYERDGRVNKQLFISFLFRLCVLSFADTKGCTDGEKSNCSRDMYSLKYVPFDPVLADLWYACFEKVYQSAKCFWGLLDKFHFEEVCDFETAALEFKIGSTFLGGSEDENLDLLMKENPDRFLTMINSVRRRDIEDIKEDLNSFKLVTPDQEAGQSLDVEYAKDSSFIVSLLNAYLSVIKEMDVDETGEQAIRSLKCLPRDHTGTILLNDVNEEISKSLIKIAPDPLGGMFIKDFKDRRKYFALRATFFRSLWDYTMKSKRFSPLYMRKLEFTDKVKKLEEKE